MRARDAVPPLFLLSGNGRGEVRTRALGPPVHRLLAERAGNSRGLPMRQQRHVRPRRVSLLPKTPLQRGGLRRQQGPPGGQRSDVHQDPGLHAVPRLVDSTSSGACFRRCCSALEYAAAEVVNRNVLSLHSLPLPAEDPLLRPGEAFRDGAVAHCLAARNQRRGRRPGA